VTQQRLHLMRTIVGPADNPLCRRVDRIERKILLVLVVVFLIAGPLLSVWAAQREGAAVGREMRAEQGWREIPAVLQQNAADGMIGLDGAWDTSWVRVSWTAPDGAARTGVIAVALSARAGQRVPVWVTAAGHLTREPLTSADVAEREATAVLVTLAVLAGLVSVAGLTGRVLTNRRRMAGWTRAWEVVGPRWSSLR
jgi:hypothetical protein